MKALSGIAKFLSPVTKYFREFEQEEASLDEIMQALEKGKSILTNDNITLEIEKNKVLEIIKRLEALYEEGQLKLSELLKTAEEMSELGDTSRTESYQKRVINVLEKKLFDIKEMMIVNEQTVLAMEVIMRNNQELIRNVDRVRSVTLSTIHTATLLAMTLNHQKITLKKLDQVYSKENRVLEGSERILQKEISANGLKESFEEAFQVYDEALEQNEDYLPENEIKVSEIQKRSMS